MAEDGVTAALWASTRASLAVDDRVSPAMQGFLDLAEVQGAIGDCIYLEVPNDLARSMLDQRIRPIIEDLLRLNTDNNGIANFRVTTNPDIEPVFVSTPNPVASEFDEITPIAPTTIEGRCPGMLRDFLEVRGLGLLNIRTIFGETASRRKMKLKLIVHLQKTVAAADAPRLPLDAQTQEILGVPIRKVVIPVAAGRNLAVLLEAAVRNTILQFRGIDSMQDFIERQQRMMLDEDV